MNRNKLLFLVLENKTELYLNFLLKEGNYHELKVKSNMGFPVLVSFLPRGYNREISCIRYFVSQLIKKLRKELTESYKFVFSFEEIKELELNFIEIKKNSFGEIEQYKVEINLIMEKEKILGLKVKPFYHKFNFNEGNLLSEEFKLKTSNTLPPNVFNKLKDQFFIPQNSKEDNRVTYNFEDRILKFNINSTKHILNIDQYL